MADEDSVFDALMRRVRAGDPEAVREVYERYSDPIRRAVRHRLHRRLRRQFDSLDFVQSVWASFIQIPADRCPFANEDELIAYLARIALNKVVEVYRQRMQGSLRATCREVPLEDANAEQPLPSPDPRPSQVFMAEEKWERLLAEQGPLLRRILELKRAGYSHEEIGEQLLVNSKFIQRFLRKLEGRMNRS